MITDVRMWPTKPASRAVRGELRWRSGPHIEHQRYEFAEAYGVTAPAGLLERVAMTREDLKRRLVAEGFRSDVYSLDGHLTSYEGLVLENVGASWNIDYSERGTRRRLGSFATESEACERMYELLVEHFGADAGPVEWGQSARGASLWSRGPCRGARGWR
jgi:hypothetical protein